MKVIVDELRCDAHGVCVAACPEVFALEDDDDIVRVSIEEPDESLRESLNGRRWRARRPQSRSRIEYPQEEHRSDEQVQQIADRLAVADVVRPLLRAGGRQGLGQMRRGRHRGHDRPMDAGFVMQGREVVVGAMRRMIGGDEIMTYHHVASHGPGRRRRHAEVTPGSGPCTTGSGPEPGSSTRASPSSPRAWCARADGWRIRHHEWNIAVKLGSMEDLFAPELGQPVRATARSGPAGTKRHARGDAPSHVGEQHLLDETSRSRTTWRSGPTWASTTSGLISPKLEAAGWAACQQGGARRQAPGVEHVGVPGRASSGSSAVHGRGRLPRCSTPCPAASANVPWEERPRSSARRWPRRGPGRRVRRRGWRWSRPTRCAADVSFVYSVRDAIDLARMAGIGVVVDFYSAWYERGLDELVRDEHRPRHAGADRRLQARHLRHPQSLRHR